MNPCERAKTEGKIEMIDYCLTAFCKSELTEGARLHLENLKYALKLKLNEQPDKTENEN